MERVELFFEYDTNATEPKAALTIGSQPAAIDNATTFFQSAKDSFGVQVPQGWIIHDVDNTGFDI
jgi:hypothetical protein